MDQMMQMRPPTQEAETLQDMLEPRPSTEAIVLQSEPRMGYSLNSDEGVERIIALENAQDDPEQTMRDFYTEDYGQLFENFLDRHVGSMTEHAYQDLVTNVKRLKRTAEQLHEYNFQDAETAAQAYALFKQVGKKLVGALRSSSRQRAAQQGKQSVPSSRTPESVRLVKETAEQIRDMLRNTGESAAMQGLDLSAGSPDLLVASKLRIRLAEKE